MKRPALKKELGLFDVYAIATGTTLSAGFFLLPGIAAQEAGPALILAYIIAAVPLIPAMFSVVELATAMPKAGGVYYFLDRSMGPLVGTIGGIGTWLALILKVSFALIGMGVYTSIFFPNLPITPVAVALALALGVLNLYGAKKSGSLQIFLVVGLLLSLIIFIGSGLGEIQVNHFDNFLAAGRSSILSSAGLVYISYVGVTKVASLAEEVADPEKNLPRGVFLALGSAILIYAVGTTVMVGVIPPDQFPGDLHPVATAAEKVLGYGGKLMVTVAALLAFISVANAGTLSASRYPLAMSRDKIFPKFFGKLSRSGSPIPSIILTVGMIIAALLFLNPTKIAKLASAFQLLMFALVCLAVIVMRESHIRSYDPGYRSPWYPWMQISGIGSSLLLIMEMGEWPQVFTLLLVIIGVVWYWYYARAQVSRNGAMYHIFERLGQLRYDELDQELRGILKEKGLREGDKFEEIVARSLVIDLEPGVAYEEVVDRVAYWLSAKVDMDATKIKRYFLEGTQVGATPVTHNVALPHLHLADLDHPLMVLVRSRKGIFLKVGHQVESAAPNLDQRIHAIFFLVSPEKNPSQHLRMLAQIASRVDDDDFAENWDAAQDAQELKEVILHNDHFLGLTLGQDKPTQSLIGLALKDLRFPEGCLVALLARDNNVLAPRGASILQDGDRITIVGEPLGIRQLEKTYLH